MISIKLVQTLFSLPSSFPRRLFAEVSAYTLHPGLPTFQRIFLIYWSRSAVCTVVPPPPLFPTSSYIYFSSSGMLIYRIHAHVSGVHKTTNMRPANTRPEAKSRCLCKTCFWNTPRVFEMLNSCVSRVAHMRYQYNINARNSCESWMWISATWNLGALASRSFVTAPRQN